MGVIKREPPMYLQSGRQGGFCTGGDLVGYACLRQISVSSRFGEGEERCDSRRARCELNNMADCGVPCSSLDRGRLVVSFRRPEPVAFVLEQETGCFVAGYATHPSRHTVRVCTRIHGCLSGGERNWGKESLSMRSGDSI